MKPHAPETVYGVYGLEPGSPSSFETDLHLILILSRIASLHAKHGNRKEHLWRDYASFLGRKPNFSYKFKEKRSYRVQVAQQPTAAKDTIRKARI